MIHSTLSPTGHRLEVSDDAPDGLTRTVWQFDVSIGILPRDWRLRLYLYQQETRPTKRHKWRRVDGTAGYGRGYNRYDQDVAMKAEDVPLPADVVAAALREFMGRVEVVV